MTRKEFEKLRVEIENQKFHSLSVHPLNYGIERLLFEKDKLQKLLTIARNVPGRTTVAKTERWHRKLARIDKSMQRFKNLQAEAARSHSTGFSTLAAHTPVLFEQKRQYRVD